MSRSVLLMDIVLSTLVFSTIALINESVESPKNDSDQLPGNNSLTCNEAKYKCAFRTGCGMALQHYLTSCVSVFHGSIKKCPESCQHALIALTSTDEGKDLMHCTCAPGDRLCLQSKQKVEICRSSVTAAMNKTRISCRTATWICNADPCCSTALGYYNKFCKHMFKGKNCTSRCRNSINILKRQEKADKLSTCICDGTEDYNCKAIQRNMISLCSKKDHKNPGQNVTTSQEDSQDTSLNEIINSTSSVGRIETASVINRITLCLSTVLLLLNT